MNHSSPQKLIISAYNSSGETPPRSTSLLKAAIIQRVSSSKKKYVQDSQASIKKQEKHIQSTQEWKHIVIKNQSTSNPGFYQYYNWIKLHDEHLVDLERPVVLEFWKILRIVNYGEVFIPSGLIYDLTFDAIKFLRQNKEGTRVQGQNEDKTLNFEKIINNFLSQNDVSDSLKSFKELRNYRNIKQIEKIYKKIQQTPTKNELKSSRKNYARSSSSKSLPKNQNSNHNNLQKNNQDVFTRNFKEAEIRTGKKISGKVSVIFESSKNCSFKPKVSEYNHALYNLSRINHDDPPTHRVCHNAQKFKTKNQDEKYVLQQKDKIENVLKEKALRFDRSIFEGNIQGIPGVNTHVSRHQYVQAQKLRTKRQQDRPTYTNNSSGNKSNSYSSLYKSRRDQNSHYHNHETNTYSQNLHNSSSKGQ